MKQYYLLIPGNPAIANHYISWIGEIKELNENIDITYVNSYITHGKKLNPKDYSYEMLKYYENILLKHTTDKKVSIIAHSIGSYFTLKLLEKYPDRIERVIVIFPYLGFNAISSLKYMYPVYLLDRIFPLTELLSKSKNIFKKWSEHVIDITDTELNACLRFGIRQCAYFNKEKYFPQIDLKNTDKVYLIHTENDKWCPTETVVMMEPYSKLVKVDIPHDFITRKNQRKQMTSIILPILL